MLNSSTVKRMSKLAKCIVCKKDAVGCNPIYHVPFCLEHLKTDCQPYECDQCKTRFKADEQVYRWNEDVICAKCLKQAAYDLGVEEYGMVSDDE